MIAVTGGAGFIGSALIWKLNNQGISDILIIDDKMNLSKNNIRNLSPLSFREILDKREFVDSLPSFLGKDCFAVLHMGACSSTTVTDRDYLRKNNYEYTKKLAEYCLENDIRFIYASSAATYGNGEEGFSDEHSDIAKLRPLNPYGQSKHDFDLWADTSGALKDITGIKYFNVYGPNENHKGDMRSFVMKSFEQIRETGKVRLFKSYLESYADGEQLRDFIYVKDAVDITLFFLNNPDINGIFNAGTGEARSWNDLVCAVFRSMEMPEIVEYIEMPASIKDQYQYYTRADMKKLKTAGFSRKMYSLEKGIEDYVGKYLLYDRHLGT
jgi:ADP-L-glycero-D-manno-heptose 6-epimerase